MDVIGRIKPQGTIGNQTYELEFLVNKKVTTIIGCRDSLRCGFLINITKRPRQHDVKARREKSEANVFKEYPDLFTGQGRLGEPY